MQFIQRYLIYGFAAVVALAWNAASWQLPFFWDTILTSSVAQYYMQHGFVTLILPADLDAGHPPLFYIYIALYLILTAKSLWMAHLTMLPVLLTGLFSFIRLLQLFEFKSREQWIGLLLFCAIPAVSTQYLLISYDAALLSLYLFALVLFMAERKILFTIVLMLIAGITGRGIFALAAIFITCFLLHRARFYSWIKFFVPGVLFFAAWYAYHYYKTGYIFAPENGWSAQRGLADAHQIFKNGISLGRVLFDMGICVLFFANVFIFFKKPKLPLRYLIWICPFLVFAFSFVFFTNPINHRYFLVCFVLMLLPVLKWLDGKRILYAAGLFVLLLAGNFQIYPGKISNAWDCTLAHIPYYLLREDFKNNSDSYVTGTVFPMNTSWQQTNLTGDTARLVNVNGGSIDSLQYILYSNIGNDFSDEQLDALQHWELVKGKKMGCIEMILYKNPRELPEGPGPPAGGP